MTGADHYELRRARPRRSIPIPADACRIFSDLFGIELPRYGQTTFSLHRRRRGVSVMFTRGLFSWDAPHYEKIELRTFAEARQWIAAYGARFGETIVEAERPAVMKRPTGADRKLLKAGGCREAWLASDVPALFTEAMMRCGHAGAYCASDGFCRLGGCDMEMMERPADVAEER